MDQSTQVDLLDEILGLRAEKSAYLDESVTYSPASRYLDQDRFQLEQQKLFRGYPLLVAHVSELAGEGDFLRRTVAGVPMLLTRDRQGQVNAFYNVCRHRGARLVEAESGCRHRFTCPYHAWTWDNQGRLIAAPHREQGFPDLEMAEYGLKRIDCREEGGWIWCQLDPDGPDIESFLAPLAADMRWLAMQDLVVHAEETRTWQFNWKIGIEGGLEAYHFRVAHAKTIGSLFHDNLSTYRAFGPHIRSILARTSVDELVEMPRAQWNLRDHANVLYNLFPSAAWLVQADHVVLLQFSPLAVDETSIRIVTFRPAQAEALSEKRQTYWDKNHALTCRTLAEDFELGESIQAGMALGVNEAVTFGRFEGALHCFNQSVETALGR